MLVAAAVCFLRVFYVMHAFNEQVLTYLLTRKFHGGICNADHESVRSSVLIMNRRICDVAAMRGFEPSFTARIICLGHVFAQHVRRPSLARCERVWSCMVVTD